MMSRAFLRKLALRFCDLKNTIITLSYVLREIVINAVLLQMQI